MMDFRHKDNRREAFIRWMVWSVKYKDCDPSLWMANYINKRYEHNDEQRLWFSWLYGNTYHLPTAWVLMNEFPDYELANLERITTWNDENYKRLRYQTDTKWNKGHLPSMFDSYHKNIGSMLQRDFFDKLCQEDNEKKNFQVVWGYVKENFHKFGRYSTWFYLQQLKHTADVPVESTNLMLSDYSGSRSHRNGLLYALGMDDKIDEKLTASEYNDLEKKSTEILQEMHDRFPELKCDIDYFAMETCLCSFKKIFRVKNGRYLGYYIDRQAEEIKQVSNDGWYGIDWDVLWQARNETLDTRLATKNDINKNKFGLFLDSGNMDRLDWMFSDSPTTAITSSGLDSFWD